jgi:ParB-like chromosome segregation protein Spo0J
VQTDLLDIEYVHWDDLRPHPMNARMGDADDIAVSIRLNGLYKPIIVAEDLTILAGHHVYAACGMLDIEMIPVVRRPIDPLSHAGLRLLAYDNRSSDTSTNDEGLLLALLQEMAAMDEGLVGSGFDEDDLAALDAELQRLALIPLNGDPDLAPRHVEFEAGGGDGSHVLNLPLSAGVYRAVMSRLRQVKNEQSLPDVQSALCYELGIDQP